MAAADAASVTPGGRGFPARDVYRAIKLVVFDVDGVLTDGRIIWDSNGVETKFFNVRDGAAITILHRVPLLTGVITGRNSKVVDLRARELQIDPDRVKQGAKVKLPVLEQMAVAAGITLAETAFVGDDLIDMPVLEKVGLACCPGDAYSEVKKICHIVAASPGGHGGAREVVEHLLKARADDSWEQAVDRYLGRAIQ